MHLSHNAQLFKYMFLTHTLVLTNHFPCGSRFRSLTQLFRKLKVLVKHNDLSMPNKAEQKTKLCLWSLSHTCLLKSYLTIHQIKQVILVTASKYQSETQHQSKNEKTGLLKSPTHILFTLKLIK